MNEAWTSPQGTIHKNKYRNILLFLVLSSESADNHFIHSSFFLWSQFQGVVLHSLVNLIKAHKEQSLIKDDWQTTF